MLLSSMAMMVDITISLRFNKYSHRYHLRHSFSSTSKMPNLYSNGILFHSYDDSFDSSSKPPTDSITFESPLNELYDNINQTESDETISSALWQTVRFEASVISDEDMTSAILMSNCILSQLSLEEAVISHVANELETELLPATQLKNIFMDVLAKDICITYSLSFDILACAMRDRDLPNVASVIIFNKVRSS